MLIEGISKSSRSGEILLHKDLHPSTAGLDQGRTRREDSLTFIGINSDETEMHLCPKLKSYTAKRTTVTTSKSTKLTHQSHSMIKKLATQPWTLSLMALYL